MLKLFASLLASVLALAVVLSAPHPAALAQAEGDVSKNELPNPDGADNQPEPKAAGGGDESNATNDESNATNDESKTVLLLSLEDAIQILIRNNFQIRSAHVERDVRFESAVIEHAVFDPFFVLSGNFAKNRRPTSSFLDIGTPGLAPIVQVNPTESRGYSGGIEGRTILGTTYSMTFSGTRFDRPLATGSIFGFNPQEEVNAGIQITQPLLRGAWWGYNSARIRISENNRRLARHELEATVTDLIYSAERAYWELSFSQKNRDARKKSLDTAQQNYDKAKGELDAGAGSKGSVTTAGSQLALRKVEHSEAVGLHSDARDRLLLLLNRTGEDSLRKHWTRGNKKVRFDGLNVIPTTEPKLDPNLPPRDESLEIAFQRRADYRQFAVQMENKNIELEIAENEMLPELNVSGSWLQHGLAGNTEDALDSLMTRDYYSWSAGVEFRVPLRMRGPKANRNRVRNEALQMRFQEADLENLIVVEVDKSIRDMAMLGERKKDIDERVRLQTELLGQEREKLQAGRSIEYNVSVIENDLVESEAQALRVAADYQIAHSDYLRATGLMLERRGVVFEDDE